MPQVPLESVADSGPDVRFQSVKVTNRLGSKYDVMAHSGQSIARIVQAVKGELSSA